MGSDQSILPEGPLRGVRRPKQDASKFSTSRPIGGGPALPFSRSQTFTRTPAAAPVVVPTRSSAENLDSAAKHNIVVVADGSVTVKDPDPELTRLNTIPSFTPIIRSSLNLVSGPQDVGEVLAKLDHHALLVMALRYQDHLRQLAEAVAFDQNAMCVRIKEVAHMIHVVRNKLQEEQKQFQKSVEQFERVTEMVTTLNKVKAAVDDIVPCMNRLNQLLPPSEQLEPCTLDIMPSNPSIQAS